MQIYIALASCPPSPWNQNSAIFLISILFSCMTTLPDLALGRSFAKHNARTSGFGKEPSLDSARISASFRNTRPLHYRQAPCSGNPEKCVSPRANQLDGMTQSPLILLTSLLYTHTLTYNKIEFDGARLITRKAARAKHESQAGRR
jgi:hypothetical protein